MPRPAKKKRGCCSLKPGIASSHIVEHFSEFPPSGELISNGHVLHIYINNEYSTLNTQNELHKMYPNIYIVGSHLYGKITSLVRCSLDKLINLKNDTVFDKFKSICDKRFVIVNNDQQTDIPAPSVTSDSHSIFSTPINTTIFSTPVKQVQTSIHPSPLKTRKIAAIVTKCEGCKILHKKCHVVQNQLRISNEQKRIVNRSYLTKAHQCATKTLNQRVRRNNITIAELKYQAKNTCLTWDTKKMPNKSGTKCVIANCQSHQKLNPELTFHPLSQNRKYPEWRSQLIAKVSGPYRIEKLDHARICSRHFLPSCYAVIGYGGPRLIPGSLPTEYMPDWSTETRTRKELIKESHTKLAPSKKFASSKVWDFFSPVSPDDYSAVDCNIEDCPKFRVRLGKPGTNTHLRFTKLLLEHLEIWHKTEYESIAATHDLREYSPTRDQSEYNPTRDLSEYNPTRDLSEYNPTRDQSECYPTKKLKNQHENSTITQIPDYVLEQNFDVDELKLLLSAMSRTHELITTFNNRLNNKKSLNDTYYVLCEESCGFPTTTSSEKDMEEVAEEQYVTSILGGQENPSQSVNRVSAEFLSKTLSTFYNEIMSYTVSVANTLSDQVLKSVCLSSGQDIHDFYRSLTGIARNTDVEENLSGYKSIPCDINNAQLIHSERTIQDNFSCIQSDPQNVTNEMIGLTTLSNSPELSYKQIVHENIQEEPSSYEVSKTNETPSLKDINAANLQNTLAKCQDKFLSKFKVHYPTIPTKDKKSIGEIQEGISTGPKYDNYVPTEINDGQVDRMQSNLQNKAKEMNTSIALVKTPQLSNKQIVQKLIEESHSDDQDTKPLELPSNNIAIATSNDKNTSVQFKGKCVSKISKFTPNIHMEDNKSINDPKTGIIRTSKFDNYVSSQVIYPARKIIQDILNETKEFKEMHCSTALIKNLQHSTKQKVHENIQEKSTSHEITNPNELRSLNNILIANGKHSLSQIKRKFVIKRKVDDPNIHMKKIKSIGDLQMGISATPMCDRISVPSEVNDAQVIKIERDPQHARKEMCTPTASVKKPQLYNKQIVQKIITEELNSNRDMKPNELPSNNIVIEATSQNLTKEMCTSSALVKKPQLSNKQIIQKIITGESNSHEYTKTNELASKNIAATSNDNNALTQFKGKFASKHATNSAIKNNKSIDDPKTIKIMTPKYVLGEQVILIEESTVDDFFMGKDDNPQSEGNQTCSSTASISEPMVSNECGIQTIIQGESYPHLVTLLNKVTPLNNTQPLVIDTQAASIL